MISVSVLAGDRRTNNTYSITLASAGEVLPSSIGSPPIIVGGTPPPRQPLPPHPPFQAAPAFSATFALGFTLRGLTRATFNVDVQASFRTVAALYFQLQSGSCVIITGISDVAVREGRRATAAPVAESQAAANASACASIARPARRGRLAAALTNTDGTARNLPRSS